jgi:molybdate transport system ATP-binding protein
MIRVENATLKIDGKVLLKDVSFVLPEGKSMALTGASGSGKTTLGRMIAGKIAATSGTVQIPAGKSCVLVEQQDNFMAASHLASGYYGQRFENLGLEEVPTVAGYMQTVARSLDGKVNQTDLDESLRQMGMLELSGRKLMFLSSGERKRVQLAVALLQKPDVLVLDQPFVGLDAAARENLEKLLLQLLTSGKTLVLICDPEQIPELIDEVLLLKNGVAGPMVPRKDFRLPEAGKKVSADVEHLFGFVNGTNPDDFQFAVKMKQVNVSFNGTHILKNIDWEVKRGERWALLGPNGSGKTTLLSLVTADNPQGYSNDLTLFDRRRGSGETVWDIKKRIGFISPELHLYFLRGKGIFNTIPGLGDNSGYSRGSLSCEKVIASGFNDLIGISEEISGVQKKTVEAWLSILQLEHLSGRYFHEASLSEQRLLLLGRALVKMPSMLILDEPCQGLDHRQSRRFTEMIDFICPRLSATLIYVTHYLEEIPKCVNQLIRLQEGKVVGK